jgi:hypothetical protein
LGTGGIDTTPAPRCPRALADFDDPVRADPRDRGVDAMGAVAVNAFEAGSAAGAVPQTSQ